MTEAIPTSEDSSSSSSYQKFNANSYLEGGVVGIVVSHPHPHQHEQQQQQQTMTSPSMKNTNNTIINPQQQQQQTPLSSSTISSSSSSSGAKRRPRFLQQQLNIAPRQFEELNQVSVIKLSDKLHTSSTGGGVSSSSVSSSSSRLSVSSLSSSTLASSSSQGHHHQQQHQSQNQKSPSSVLSVASTFSSSVNSPSCSSSSTTSSSSKMNNQRAGSNMSTISTISSSTSSTSNLPSPQPTKTAQFGFSSPAGGSNGASQQQQENEDEDDSTSGSAAATYSSSSSSGFTASLVHPNIYLGSAMDAYEAAELIARGIFFVLNVAYECDFSNSLLRCGRIQKKKINLKDNVQENIERAFDEGISFIDQAISQGAKILVHCFVGSSRSPTIVIAYLMRKFAEKDLDQQIFAATRSSIISQHQQSDRQETAKSPTMIEGLLLIQQQQQEQQVQSSQTQPQNEGNNNNSGISSSTATTTTVYFPPMTPTFVQPVQPQQHRQSSTVSFSSTVSSTASSTSSYYKSALEQVQKARPEVLPNFAFACALQKMDDQLLLRATA